MSEPFAASPRRFEKPDERIDGSGLVLERFGDRAFLTTGSAFAMPWGGGARYGRVEVALSEFEAVRDGRVSLHEVARRNPLATDHFKGRWREPVPRPVAWLFWLLVVATAIVLLWSLWTGPPGVRSWPGLR